MTYRWTDRATAIAEIARRSDGIEIAACRDLGEATERLDPHDPEPADFYSVYLHFDPEWDDDPNGLRGAVCIADRQTLREALDFAEDLAARWSLPVTNFAEHELQHDAHVRQLDRELHRHLAPCWSWQECRNLWRHARRRRAEQRENDRRAA
jgi:hypothetical protein